MKGKKNEGNFVNDSKKSSKNSQKSQNGTPGDKDSKVFEVDPGFAVNAREIWRKKQIRRIIFALLIFSALWFGPTLYSYFQNPPQEVALSEIVRDIKTEVEKGDARDRVTVRIIGQLVQLEIEGKKTIKISPLEEQTGFSEILSNEDIALGDINYKPEIPFEFPWVTILNVALIGMAIGALYYFAKNMQSSGSRLMNFGQSKAQLLLGKKTGISFEDVAGSKEAKQELMEVVDFLRNPKKYKNMGARIPKGVILVGPPGSGKTLMARAVAGEASVPFFHTSGAEFEEMLVGAGASRVRDLFTKAKRVAPSLIFVDEIDAVARKRGTVLQSGNTEQTLNQILVEMDGFEQNDNVIVIAATNRPDVLDPAILRPGRFDRRVTLEYPNLEERKEIIQVHSKNKPLGDDFNIDVFAKRMVGTSGAEIENTLNESAIIAARDNRKKITMEDLDEASLKVAMGPERRRKISKDVLKATAYHEAGHALTAKFTKGTIPVHKVSIIPRGQSRGHTSYLPDEDSRNKKSELVGRLIFLIGGYAAEKIIYKETGSGASDDIKKATGLARKMVTEWGMSDKIGFLKVAEDVDDSTVGFGYGEGLKISDKTATIVDEEIKKLVDEAEKKAIKVLSENKEILDEMAEQLLEQETILGEDVDEIIRKFGKEPLSKSESFSAEKKKD